MQSRFSHGMIAYWRGRSIVTRRVTGTKQLLPARETRRCITCTGHTCTPAVDPASGAYRRGPPMRGLPMHDGGALSPRHDGWLCYSCQTHSGRTGGHRRPARSLFAKPMVPPNATAGTVLSIDIYGRLPWPRCGP